MHVLKKGGSLDDILELPLREELAGLKYFSDDEFDEKLELFYENLDKMENELSTN